MKKTYCIFSANYLPNLGGVERYTYNLGKHLVKLGNKVIIVTSNTNHLKSVEIMENMKIIRLPCFNLLNGRFPVSKFNKEYLFLIKILAHTPIDVVIVNTRFYLHSYIGVKFAKKKKISPIVIEHGTAHFTVNNPLLDWCGHIYEHFISLLVKHNCKEFFGVSQACVEWLKHFNIKAKGILYNAIDIEHINQLLVHPTKDYRKLYNIKDDDIIITYTGRLVKEKGVLQLIKAFKKLNSSSSNLFLFIAGAGDLLSEIKEAEDKHTIILGKLQFEDVISLLKQTNIFCLPTIYPEGFPTSVLEAVACKCFIITTDAGGSKELIVDNSYGIIMQDNYTKTIYKALNYAIRNENYRNQAIQKSYDYLLKHFTWNITANSLEKYIEINSLTSSIKNYI